MGKIPESASDRASRIIAESVREQQALIRTYDLVHYSAEQRKFMSSLTADSLSMRTAMGLESSSLVKQARGLLDNHLGSGATELSLLAKTQRDALATNELRASLLSSGVLDQVARIAQSYREVFEPFRKLEVFPEFSAALDSYRQMTDQIAAYQAPIVAQFKMLEESMAPFKALSETLRDRASKLSSFVNTATQISETFRPLLNNAALYGAIQNAANWQSRLHRDLSQPFRNELAEWAEAIASHEAIAEREETQNYFRELVVRLNSNTHLGWQDIIAIGLAILALVIALLDRADFTDNDRQKLEQTRAATIELVAMAETKREAETYLLSLPRGLVRQRGNVREEPNGAANLLVSLPRETEVAVEGKTSGSWLKIVFRDRVTDELRSGYVWKRSIEISE